MHGHSFKWAGFVATIAADIMGTIGKWMLTENRQNLIDEKLVGLCGD